MPVLPVKFFTSRERGAPVLNGAVGCLRALLDACLLTGFNVVGITGLTVNAGKPRFAVVTPHGFTAGNVITLSGALPESVNGEYRVSLVGNDWVELDSIATPVAVNAATFRRAPLGWVRGFGEGDKVSYKSQHPLASGAGLAIDDSGADSAIPVGRTRIIAYEKMTTWGAGENLIIDSWWLKGRGARADIVDWELIGDDRIFYLLVRCAKDVNSNVRTCCVFGDITNPEKRAVNIVVANGSKAYPTNDAADYLGSWPRLFVSEPNALFSSRTYENLASIGVSAFATMLFAISTGKTSVSGFNAVLSDARVCGGSALPPLPGILLLAHSTYTLFGKSADGRYMCIPVCAAGGSTGTPSDSTNLGAVWFDIEGPWR